MAVVVAWDPDASTSLDTALFVECKKPGERVRKKQGRWFAAAITLGVRPEACAVAVRTFRWAKEQGTNDLPVTCRFANSLMLT